MAADAWSYFIAHPEAVFKETWCVGPYAGVDYNSPNLIVNSIVSYPIHPHYKGKRVEWGKSLLLVEHICI